MQELVPLLLFLHVLGAIVAFGPTFAFPIIGALAAREPQHRPFVARLNLRIIAILVIPFALSMAITGALLIWAAGWPLGQTRWLETGIAVYAVAVVLSVFVALPNSRRIAELVGVPPPALPQPALPQPAEASPAGGPPPELLERVRRGQLLGYLQTALLMASSS